MNIDAIRTSLAALGLPEAAIEAAVAAATATQERDAAAADLAAAEAAMATARARALAAGILAPPPAPHAASPRRVAGGRICACGCGATTKGGVWMPGHDARHGGYKARVAAQQ